MNKQWQLLVAPEIEEELDIKLEEMFEPPYRVFVHNDDETPFDFVIIALQRFFSLSPAAAEHVAVLAHMTGISYVATLSKKEAERQVGQAHFAASLEGYPLTFSIEPE